MTVLRWIVVGIVLFVAGSTMIVGLLSVVAPGVVTPPSSGKGPAPLEGTGLPSWSDARNRVRDLIYR